MKIQYFDSLAELSRESVRIILEQIHARENLLLCTATGNSPTQTYRNLEAEKITFNAGKLRIVKLDEWGGVQQDAPGTCERYLREQVLVPLGVEQDNYFSFRADASDPEAECRRMNNVLDKEGPIDLCILGIGANGHIGFNEPDAYLEPRCHIAKLSEESKKHSMAKGMNPVPAYGLTLGVSDILQSKKILIIITGTNKKTALARLLEQKVSTDIPASMLWLHPDVHCMIDRNACPD